MIKFIILNNLFTFVKLNKQFYDKLVFPFTKKEGIKS
jgi:hypothetical protein